MKACSKCGGLISWKRDSGRAIPVNEDGSDHYDECSKRQWQIVVSTGKRFFETNASGYKTPDGVKHYDRIWGYFTKRTSFDLPDCDCEVAPWDDCIHTEQAAEEHMRITLNDDSIEGRG